MVMFITWSCYLLHFFHSEAGLLSSRTATMDGSNGHRQRHIPVLFLEKFTKIERNNLLEVDVKVLGMLSCVNFDGSISN